MQDDEDRTKAVGVDLGFYRDDLHRVPDEFDEKPSLAFDAWERVGPVTRAYVEEQWGPDADFGKIYYHLPLTAFGRLTFDELCKLRHSSGVMMDSSVEELFRKDPRHVVVRKIASSLWRWGRNEKKWNEIVDAYDGLRRFDLGLPGFDAVLDYTTGWNERGASEHSRTFLDGVFGFMVRHRGQHVMTVGFSFAGDRRLLLQQVQSARQKGNRWLYSFPQRRVEFVIDRLQAAFPDHSILVVDGAELARSSIESYRRGLGSARARVERARAALESGSAASWHAEDLESALKDEANFLRRIKHLEGDTGRLAEFYADTGRHAREGEAVKINGLTHHPLSGPRP
jgi:hypothetical protein